MQFDPEDHQMVRKHTAGHKIHESGARKCAKKFVDAPTLSAKSRNCVCRIVHGDERYLKKRFLIIMDNNAIMIFLIWIMNRAF